MTSLDRFLSQLLGQSRQSLSRQASRLEPVVLLHPYSWSSKAKRLRILVRLWNEELMMDLRSRVPGMD